MRIGKFLLCGLLMALPVLAEEAEDRQTATSLHYVSHELDTRQNKLSAGTNAALTYTNAAGNVEQRTVKENLNGGTTDTSLPMAEAVNAGLNTKQDDITTIDDHTAVTYTSQVGTIGQKGIYQDTGTYAEQSDSLIDAKTFNAALKNGLDSEFVCGGTSPNGTCWLWQIHTNTVLSDYTPVEYIESTGTQYIDTGITDVTDSEFTLVAQQTELLTNFPTLLGAMDGSSFKVVFAYGSNDKFYTQTGVGGSEVILLGTQDLNKHTFNLVTTGNTQIFAIDGTSATRNYVTVSSTTYPLFLFARNRGGTVGNQVKQKVFSFSAKKNGELIRNLIPAIRNSDDKVGMYDTVSGTFFTNAATSGSDFTAGDPINNIVYIPQNQQ